MDSDLDESSDFQEKKVVRRKRKTAVTKKGLNTRQKNRGRPKSSNITSGGKLKSTKTAERSTTDEQSTLEKCFNTNVMGACQKEDSPGASSTKLQVKSDEGSPCPTCGKLFNIPHLLEHTKACLHANFEACKDLTAKNTKSGRKSSTKHTLNFVPNKPSETSLPYFCVSCGTDLSLLSYSERNTHVNKCLDSSSKLSKEVGGSKTINKNATKNKSSSDDLRCVLCFKVLSTSRGLKQHLSACQKKNNISTMAALALNRPERKSELVDDEILAEIRRAESKDTADVEDGAEVFPKPVKKKVPKKRKPKKDIETYNEEMMQLAISLSNGEDLEKKRSKRSRKQNTKYIIPVMLELSPNSKRQQLEGRLHSITNPEEESSEDEKIPCTPALPTTSLRLSNVRVVNGNSEVGDDVEAYKDDTGYNADRPGPSGISSHQTSMPRDALPELPTSHVHSPDRNRQSPPVKSHDDELQSPEVSSSNIKHHTPSDSSESPGGSSIESVSSIRPNQHLYANKNQSSRQRIVQTSMPESRWSIASKENSAGDSVYRVRKLLSQFDKPNTEVAQNPVSCLSDSADCPLESAVPVSAEEERKDTVDDENIDSTLLAIQALDNREVVEDSTMTSTPVSPPFDDQIYSSQRSESQKLHILIDNPEFSDAKILAGESKEVINLHKNILYCNCSGLLDEIKLAEDKNTDLHLKEHSKSEIMPLISFIYSGRIEPLIKAAEKSKHSFAKIMQLMKRYKVHITDTDQMLLDAAVEQQTLQTQFDTEVVGPPFTTDAEIGPEIGSGFSGMKRLSSGKVSLTSQISHPGSLTSVIDASLSNSPDSGGSGDVLLDDMSFQEDLEPRNLTLTEPATGKIHRLFMKKPDQCSGELTRDDITKSNPDFESAESDPILSDDDLFAFQKVSPEHVKHVGHMSPVIFRCQNEKENRSDIAKSDEFTDKNSTDKDDSFLSFGSSVFDDSRTSFEEDYSPKDIESNADAPSQLPNSDSLPNSPSSRTSGTPVKRKQKDQGHVAIRKSRRMSASGRRSSLTKNGWKHKNCPCCSGASDTVYIKDKLPNLNTRERRIHKSKLLGKRRDVRKSLLTKRTMQRKFAVIPGGAPRLHAKSPKTPKAGSLLSKKKIAKSIKNGRSQTQHSASSKVLRSTSKDIPLLEVKNEQESRRKIKQPKSSVQETDNVKSKKLKLSDAASSEKQTPTRDMKKINRRSRPSLAHKTSTQTVYVSERLPRFKEREHIRSRPEVANMGKSTKSVARLSGSKVSPVVKKSPQSVTEAKNEPDVIQNEQEVCGSMEKSNEKEVSGSIEKSNKKEVSDSVEKSNEKDTFGSTEKSNEKEVSGCMEKSIEKESSGQLSEQSIDMPEKPYGKKYKFKKVLLMGYACPSPSAALSQPCPVRKVSTSSEDGYESDSLVLDNICFDDSFEEDCLDATSKSSPITCANSTNPLGHMMLSQSATPNSAIKDNNRFCGGSDTYIGPVPITPMPNFKDMATPELLHRASNMGLKKTLGKVKLKTKLEEEYWYTHQLASDDEGNLTGTTAENVAEDDLSDDLSMSIDRECDISLQLSKLSASPSVFRSSNHIFSFSALTVEEVQELSTKVIETMHDDGSLLTALQEAKEKTGSIKRGSRQDRDRCWDIVTPGRPDYNPQISAILSLSEEFQNAISRPLTACIVKHYNEHIKYQFDCLGIVCDQMEGLLKERLTS